MSRCDRWNASCRRFARMGPQVLFCSRLKFSTSFKIKRNKRLTLLRTLVPGVVRNLKATNSPPLVCQHFPRREFYVSCIYLLTKASLTCTSVSMDMRFSYRHHEYSYDYYNNWRTEIIARTKTNGDIASFGLQAAGRGLRSAPTEWYEKITY
jgi:hypothetical protein